MSFTNQALGALGTATGALAAGQHIAEQKKSLVKQEEANKLATIAEVSKVNKDIEAYNQRDIDHPEEEIEKELNVLSAKEGTLNLEAEDLNNKLGKLNEKRDEEFLKTGKDNFGYAMAVEKNIKRQEEINSNLAMLKRSKMTLGNEVLARRAQKSEIEAHRNAVLEMAQKAGLEFKDLRGGNK